MYSGTIGRSGEPCKRYERAGRITHQLAVNACVASFWTGRRSTGPVKALLDVSVDAVEIPKAIRGRCLFSGHVAQQIGAQSSMRRNC
jgi:hypothetical protein